MAKVYHISSTLNDRLKQWALLSTSKGRRREGRFLCEGVKVVQTAVDYGLKPESLILCEEKFPVAPESYQSEEIFFLTENAFKKFSTLKVNQGIAAIFRIPDQKCDFLFNMSDFFILVAFGVQDPGNLGAIIRVAAGSGCTAFISVGESADLYSPKVIRGSSGLVFSIPALNLSEEDFENFISTTKSTVYSTTGADGIDYKKVVPEARSLLIIGSEGSGMPEKWLNFDVKVTIPLSNNCESLNAAVAAGILAFHLAGKK